MDIKQGILSWGERQVVRYMNRIMPRYLHLIEKMCNPEIPTTEDSVVIHNPFINMIGICNTVVLAYIFADKTEKNDVKKIMNLNINSKNPLKNIFSNIVNLFYESKEITLSDERNMPQTNLLLDLCPKFKKVSNLIIPIAVSYIFDLKIWDGNGMIYLNDADKVDKIHKIDKVDKVDEETKLPMIFIWQPFDPDLCDSKTLSPLIDYKGEKYIPTKFISDVLGHIYGGVIRYD